jgi:hypothetical protein
MKVLKGIVAALILALSTTPIEASPITGGMSISGNFRPVNGQTGVGTTLGLATALDFMLTGGLPSPGVAGSFQVDSANGVLAMFVGQYGTIKDFTFAGSGSANFPNLSVPLIAFQSIGGLTFTLTSISAPLFQNNAALVLNGHGILKMNGFSDTAGTFDFTANGAQGTFSFSASNGGAQVPEPASLAVLGGGLLICAATLSRRQRRSKK